MIDDDILVMILLSMFTINDISLTIQVKDLDNKIQQNQEQIIQLIQTNQ